MSFDITDWKQSGGRMHKINHKYIGQYIILAVGCGLIVLIKIIRIMKWEDDITLHAKHSYQNIDVKGLS